MKQRLLMSAFVIVVAAMTLAAYDTWGLLGSGMMIALSIALHMVMVRRHEGMEERLTQLLDRMSDDEICAELAKMAQPEQEEIERALHQMGRTIRGWP